MIIAGNGVVARIDHRQLDVQRATQAYLEFMPLASQNSIFEAHIRDYGWKTPSDIQVYIEPGAGKAGAIGLTYNTESIYASAQKALDYYRKRFKIYPLATGPRADAQYTSMSFAGGDTTHPRESM